MLESGGLKNYPKIRYPSRPSCWVFWPPWTKIVEPLAPKPLPKWLHFGSRMEPGGTSKTMLPCKRELTFALQEGLLQGTLFEFVSGALLGTSFFATWSPLLLTLGRQGCPKGSQWGPQWEPKWSKSGVSNVGCFLTGLKWALEGPQGAKRPQSGQK